ncbi:L,D-transpeptidase [Candidatus Woesebacteria bacterium]|nr:L,D-transpeptidase [Candidatus Woesebacteria bacterium]
MHRVLVAIISLLFVFIGYLLLYQFTFPNTKIGNEDVSFIPVRKLHQVLRSFYEKPIEIQVEDRVYRYSYSDLGILLDKDALNKLVSDYDKNPIGRLISFLGHIVNRNTYEVPIIFSESYYSFIEKTVFDFSEESEIMVDTASDQLVHNPQKKYRLDSEALKKELMQGFSRQRPIQAKLTTLESVLGASVEAYNARITRAVGTSISIHVQTATPITVILSPDEIRTFVEIERDFGQGEYQISLNEEVFMTLLTQKNKLVRNGDAGLEVEEVREKVRALITDRMNGLLTDDIIVDLKTLPNTDGSYAEKYIEVDISQQKMYLFQGGSRIATHSISSGLYYPTPKGEFKILNKAKNAYSDIYHVYMPYWMAFYYGPDVQAYFGIHELPYWVSSDGSKHQRPREFIGQPKTGGCVALDVGVAREVYEFSEVGMTVVIFE